MATVEQYKQWLDANAGLKGTEDYDLVQGVYDEMLTMNPEDIPEIEPSVVPTQTTPEQKERSWGEAIAQNADIPMGITGSILGGALGSVGGPAGTISGSVIGGGLGTFFGTLVSQGASDEELNFAEAATNAAFNMGLDIATFKAGKFLPDLKWFKTQLGMGKTAEEAAEALVTRAGSPESLQATQKMLSQGGATLTPFQTGQSTMMTRLAERVGQIGIFSSDEFVQNAAKASRAVQQEIDRVFNIMSGENASTIGGNLKGIIAAGRESLSDMYEQGITNLIGKLPARQVSVNPLRVNLSRIVEGKSIVGTKLNQETGELFSSNISSELSETTQKFLREQLKMFDDVVSIDGKAILQFEKKLSQKQRELYKVGDGASKEAANELKVIAEELKDVYGLMLRKIDPKLADEYLGIKKAYSQGINSLLPDINKNLINSANTSDAFESLGKLIVGEGNLDKAKALMGSIDQAYALAAKNGTLDALPYASAKEAKQHLRSSFLSTQFANIMDEGFDVTKYRNIANRLSRPQEAAKMKVLFGEQYPAFRQIMNAIEEMSKQSSGDIGSLMWRAQEYKAGRMLGSSLLQMGAGAGAGYFLGDLTAAGAGAFTFLFIPKIMAKIATNPATANRLLNITKGTFSGMKGAIKAAAVLGNDVLINMTQDERDEVAQWLMSQRDPNEQQYQQRIPDRAVGAF